MLYFNMLNTMKAKDPKLVNISEYLFRLAAVIYFLTNLFETRYFHFNFEAVCILNQSIICK